MPHRIYPNIAFSQKYNSVSTEAQLLYLSLFAFVDDFGTFLASPDDIKALIFPKKRKMTITRIIKCEQELLQAQLLQFYTYNDKAYLQINSFKSFQVFGEGYNRIPKYPPYDEKDHSAVVRHFGVLKEENYVLMRLPADLLKTLVNAYHTTYSITNTNTNTNTISYKEEDIDKLDLEEKGVLKCFYTLGFKLKEKEAESWNKWVLELKKDYKDKDLLANAKKWRDYFEQKPPKNFKNSFRNWVAKPYADTKPQDVVKYDEASRKFQERYKQILKK